MADPLKIALLTTTYWPDPAGIGLYATEIAEYLAGNGHAVHVVSTVPHYPQWEIAPEYRGRRRCVEHRNGVDIDRLWLYVPRRQTALKRAAYEASFVVHALATLRPPPALDLVLALVPNLGNAVVGLAWAARSKARSVVFVQDLSGSGAQESGLSGGGFVAGLVSRVEGLLVRRADVVTVCSESFRGELEDMGVGDDRIMAFPNWSRLESKTGRQERVRAQYGWSPDDRVVLHAGNMGMKQDLVWVAEYAKEASKIAPCLQFVFVGHGNQRPDIEARTAGLDNVQFIDPVEEAELPGLLRAADVLFLHERPGLQEMSVPSKLTAYFSAGRPVVAAVETGSPGAAEVRNAGAGLVTPAGRPSQLVGLLADLVSDESRCQALGAAGQAYAEREMTREAAMRRLDEIISKAVSSSTAEPAER